MFKFYSIRSYLRQITSMITNSHLLEIFTHLIQQSNSIMQEGQYKSLQDTTQFQFNETQNYGLLMVNSESGSRLGCEFMKFKDNQMMKVAIFNCISIIFSVYDFYKQKQRQQAFTFAQNKLDEGNTVYIIICGGDGTVEWVIDEMRQSKVSLQKLIFTVLPLGTGNDFAKSLGWGKFKFEVNKKNIELLAKEIQKSKIGLYDVWEVTIQCFSQGKITQIKNGKQVSINGLVLNKNFTNYFGVGTDAQISYIAQKLHAKSILLKKIAYSIAGFLSFWMFCGSLTWKIKQMFQINANNPQSELLKEATQIRLNEKQTILDMIAIGQSDCCFTFINSTSTMELEGVWKTPHSTNSKIQSAHKEQYVDDGFIEIVSYRNQISLCFERAIHMAKKAGQGKGPFIVNFKKPKQGVKHSVYIHINGQPYKVQNIKSIKISKSQSFPSSKIRVLFRKN